MSPSATHQAAGAPASQPVFPDEILEDIFLRLDAVEDLARASAACTTFRRVVSARRFLHRFRCLHPPPVLGVLEFDACGTFHPAQPPHRSAPAARALAQAADFTFSFVEAPELWKVCDARDGRVLLYRRVNFTTDLMVCDPLHRRHIQLPAIPDDLAAAAGGSGLYELDAFLDPDTDKDKEKQDLSFRVICAVQCEDKLVTFHFSSVTRQWRGITINRTQWRGITINRTIPLCSGFLSSPKIFFKRHYAHGCYFWMIGIINSYMLMLNMHDMELSVVDLPPGIGLRDRAIVEAGEGMIGLFYYDDVLQQLQLYYKSLQGTEWQHKRIIPLPKQNSPWNVVGAASGYLLLKITPSDCWLNLMQESQYFTLNLKTFLVEELCVSHTRSGLLYASFLSPFSLPSI